MIRPKRRFGAGYEATHIQVAGKENTHSMNSVKWKIYLIP